MPSTSTRPGLTSEKAKELLEKFGPNALPHTPPTPLWLRFARQFKSPLIAILLIALAVDAIAFFAEGAHGLPIESIAIAIILLLNAGLGVYQEAKSESALAKLAEMTAPLAWVMRDGTLAHLPVTEIVPGDLARVEAGDRIGADGVIADAEGVTVDESVLTGESVPVDKSAGDELLSGTLLVRGRTFIEVARTGESSAMGRLAAMLGRIHAEKTPLERRLATFGNVIARAVIVLVVLIAVGGILLEGLGQAAHVLLFAVALAVAAVPEGLPAVLTLTLALGVERMARKKAVVRRLSAVEALGSVTVIATDKTGTLTENRMFVKGVELTGADPAPALRAMALANDADEAAQAGDPLELALLAWAAEHGLDPARARDESPRRAARPFDSAAKFMRVTVEERGSVASYLKGAPEVVIARSRLSDDERREWTAKAEARAGEGARVLALGRREGEGDDDVEFLGLVLLWDPPRKEVPDAIRRARDAGIRIVMITGDHPATALAVARATGIEAGSALTGADLESMTDDEWGDAARSTTVFARVSPEHKLRLVEAMKRNGDVVAMTGDGVNDAPALKRSDVGIAMGDRGSDVAREVADLVLLDDNFATIVAAVEEGRNIYANIRKFIRFLFATNLAEVAVVVVGAFGAALMGLRDAAGALLLPLTAVQLLWVNIVTDGPPALALGLDRDPGVTKEKPRDPKSPLLDRESLAFILSAGGLKAALGGALLIALPLMGYSLSEANTALFLHTTIGQLFIAYPARRIGAPPARNWALHAAVVFGVLLQILTVTAPWLRELLGLVSPSLGVSAIAALTIVLTWVATDAVSRVVAARHRSRERAA